MMLHKTLSVDLSHEAYPLYIGDHLLESSALFAGHIGARQVMVVTNETVAKLYLAPLQEALADYQQDCVILPDGEQYKTAAQWLQILDVLVAKKHHRDTTLITLGGGVVGDMGGFAAATYQRGIPFIQIPTTLLAQVDASVGGKTAVNHPAGKNFIGAFHQPKAVIMDINLLKTLPKREFSAGLAEVIKHAMIADESFFIWLEENMEALMCREKSALLHAITQACKIKCDIVVQDEKEQGNRALLNLGHTFAHAIEHVLHYGTWLHGEAVAVGLLLACQLSETSCQFSVKSTARVRALLERAKLPTALPVEVNTQELIDAIRMDKKVLNSTLRFILIRSIGQTFIDGTVSEKMLSELFC